jgi:GTP diphosphokinase / guanosine-3',5'-bis(diphosphate) 3'-diphosphatase
MVDKLIDTYHLKEVDDLLENIGLGNILPLAVTRQLTNLLKKEEHPVAMVTDPFYAVPIRGTEGMVVNFAHCCRPIPGDTILGIIQPGQGLMIHVEDCKAIAKDRYNAEKCIPLQWHEQIKGEFPVDIIIDAVNQRGMLAQLTSIISTSESDINNVYLVETEGGEYCKVKITLSVRDRTHLARVIRKIRNLSLVIHIARLKESEKA